MWNNNQGNQGGFNFGNGNTTFNFGDNTGNGNMFNFGNNNHLYNNNWKQGPNMEHGKNIDPKKLDEQSRLRFPIRLTYALDTKNVLLDKCENLTISFDKLEQYEKNCENSGDIITKFRTEFTKKLARASQEIVARKKVLLSIIEKNKDEIQKRITIFKDVLEKTVLDNFKLKEENRTELTPLLTHCYDVFEIIFSFLEFKELVLSVSQACAFFRSVVETKIYVDVDLPFTKFQYPIHSHLSRFKIRGLKLRFFDFNQSKVNLNVKMYDSLEKVKTILTNNRSRLRSLEYCCPFSHIDSLIRNYTGPIKKNDDEIRKDLLDFRTSWFAQCAQPILKCQNLKKLDIGCNTACYTTRFFKSLVVSKMSLVKLKMDLSFFTYENHLQFAKDERSENFKALTEYLMERGYQTLEVLKFQVSTSVRFMMGVGEMDNDTKMMDGVYDMRWSLFKCTKLRILALPCPCTKDMNLDFVEYLLTLDKLTIIRLDPHRYIQYAQSGNLPVATKGFSKFVESLKTVLDEYQDMEKPQKLPCVCFVFFGKIHYPEISSVSFLAMEVSLKIVNLNTPAGTLDNTFSFINREMSVGKVKFLSTTSASNLNGFDHKLSRKFLFQSNVKHYTFESINVGRSQNSVVNVERVLSSLMMGNDYESASLIVTYDKKVHVYLDNVIMLMFSKLVRMNKKNFKRFVITKSVEDCTPKKSSSFDFSFNTVSGTSGMYRCLGSNEFQDDEFVKGELVNAIKRNKYLEHVYIFGKWQGIINDALQSRSEKIKK